MANTQPDSTTWPLADGTLSTELLDLVQQASHYRYALSFGRRLATGATNSNHRQLKKGANEGASHALTSNVAMYTKSGRSNENIEPWCF